MTDEQAIHAIWGLLSEKERPRLLTFFESTGNWFAGHPGQRVLIPEAIAHRAILDAARECLDLAGVEIFPPGNGNSGWVWYTDNEFCTEQEDVFDTRTLTTYHALAWLKDAGRQDSGQKGKSE